MTEIVIQVMFFETLNNLFFITGVFFFLKSVKIKRNLSIFRIKV